MGDELDVLDELQLAIMSVVSSSLPSVGRGELTDQHFDAIQMLDRSCRELLDDARKAAPNVDEKVLCERLWGPIVHGVVRRDIALMHEKDVAAVKISNVFGYVAAVRQNLGAVAQGELTITM